MRVFCVPPVLHSGFSEHKLNRLTSYSGCASTQRLMKMQGMSNKGKTSFKRQDRTFLVNVTLAAAHNWFGWQVPCELGPERKTPLPLLSSCSTPEMEPYFPQCNYLSGFLHRTFQCGVGVNRKIRFTIHKVPIETLFYTTSAPTEDSAETAFPIFIKVSVEITNTHLVRV